MQRFHQTSLMSMKVLHLLCVLVTSITICYGQGGDDLSFELSNPLEPGEIQYPSLLGASVSLGPNWQTGDLKSEYCDCPAFTNGSGLRFDIGVVYDDFISRKWTWGIGLGYSYTTITANYQQIEDFAVQLMESGEKLTVPVKTQQLMKSTFSSISAIPYVKFYPTKWLWLRVGPHFDFIMSTSQKQTLDLLQRKITTNTGEEYAIEFDKNNPTIPPNATVNPVQAVIYDGVFPSVNKFQFGISPSFGFDVRLGRRVFFSPFFQFNLPLTGYSSTSSQYKLASFLIGLEVKVRLGELPPKPVKK